MLAIKMNIFDFHKNYTLLNNENFPLLGS